jgi:hypothetical protein
MIDGKSILLYTSHMCWLYLRGLPKKKKKKKGGLSSTSCESDIIYNYYTRYYLMMDGLILFGEPHYHVSSN